MSSLYDAFKSMYGQIYVIWNTVNSPSFDFTSKTIGNMQTLLASTLASYTFLKTQILNGTTDVTGAFDELGPTISLLALDLTNLSGSDKTNATNGAKVHSQAALGDLDLLTCYYAPTGELVAQTFGVMTAIIQSGTPTPKYLPISFQRRAQKLMQNPDIKSQPNFNDFVKNINADGTPPTDPTKFSAVATILLGWQQKQFPNQSRAA